MVAVYASSPSAITITNWNSLAAAGRANSAVVDNSGSGRHGGSFEATVEMASNPTAGTNYVELWLVPSVDGTTLGALSGVFVGSFAVSTSATTNILTFEISAALGILPKYFAIALVNRTDKALAASGSALRWVGSNAA